MLRFVVLSIIMTNAIMPSFVAICVLMPRVNVQSAVRLSATVPNGVAPKNLFLRIVAKKWFVRKISKMDKKMCKNN